MASNARADVFRPDRRNKAATAPKDRAARASNGSDVKRQWLECRLDLLKPKLARSAAPVGHGHERSNRQFGKRHGSDDGLGWRSSG